MVEYKLMGVESPRTGEEHLWMTKDGKSMSFEDVANDLFDMQEQLHDCHGLLETAVDAMSTNGIQCGLSQAWLDEAIRVVGLGDEEAGPPTGAVVSG